MAEQTDPRKNPSADFVKMQRERLQQAKQVKQVQKVDFDKETKKQILTTLKSIREQIVESKKRNNTASDVAADILASGGGPFAAAKAALSFKGGQASKKLKDRFDPLNIINRATGSKLATVLAGRAMGRSEQSIRRAAGLQRQMEMPAAEQTAPSMVEKVNETREEESKVLRVENGKMISSLEFMSKTLAVIAKKVSDISDKMGATKKFRIEEGTRIRETTSGKFATKDMVETEKMQSDFLRRIWDELKEQNILTEKFRDEQLDRASTDRYKDGFAKRKAAIVKDTVPQTEEEGGIMGFLKSLLPGVMAVLGPALLPLAAAIAPVVAAFGLLGTGAVLVYKNLDKFKLSFSLFKDSLLDFKDMIVTTVGKMQDWLVETLTAGGDLIIDAGRAVVKGVKSFLGIKQTPEEERAELEKEAAAGSGYAQRKLAKELAPQAKVESVAEKVTANVGSAVTGTPQNSVTQKSIEDGSLKQQVIDSLTGKQAPSGSPEDKAAIGKVSQAVGKTYRELYKDTEGKPLASDPRLAERLPGVVDATLKSLSGSIEQLSNQPIAPAVPKVSEVKPRAPKTGEMLSKAADMKADMALKPQNQQITPVINNIHKSSVNNNTIHQGLPSVRGGESSFMRVLDRSFAAS